MKQLSVQDLIKVAANKGYKIFDNDSKNYNINIWGIRKVPGSVNSFDDLIVVFWKFKGLWELRIFPATTEPGTYWLNNPLSKLGTAILIEGQHRALWKKGLHQGKYSALVQASPVTVIRDWDKDSQLDYDSGRKETGYFGINCHRASANGGSIQVDKWSAGCQVLQNRKIGVPESELPVYEFDYFMSLCDYAADTYGNSFTYTLIKETDI